MGALLSSTSTTPRNLLRLRGLPWLIRMPAARQTNAVMIKIADMDCACFGCSQIVTRAQPSPQKSRRGSVSRSAQQTGYVARE